jgi:glucose/arabinose dehydrogenase
MRLERRRFVHGRLVGSSSLIHGIRSGAVHDSGRIAFGPGRRLYVSTGDSGEGALAQDPRSLNGKLLALAPSRYHARGHAVPHDEVDEIVPGGNFGWPVAIGDETAGGRFLAPLRLYVAPVAPSGATFARGRSHWRGDFLFATLRGVALEQADVMEHRLHVDQLGVVLDAQPLRLQRRPQEHAS